MLYKPTNKSLLRLYQKTKAETADEATADIVRAIARLASVIVNQNGPSLVADFSWRVVSNAGSFHVFTPAVKPKLPSTEISK